MKTSRKVLLIPLLLAASVLMAACGSPPAATSAPSAPTARPATAVPATVAPTATSIPPTAVPPTATPLPPTATEVPTEPADTPVATAVSGFDGEWEGTSSTDSPLNFRIENNIITYLLINYAYSSGGCSASGAYGNGPKDASLNGNKFSAQITDSDGVQYTINGTMTSSSEASGTLEVKGKTLCGDTDAKATWTAKNTSVATAPGDNVTPTEVALEASPTAESGVSSAKDVFGLFFLSLDTKDVEGALAQVSDNVIFHIGTTSGIGKDSLKAYLQQQVDNGIVYMGSDVNITGDVITFSVKATQPSGAVAASYNHSVVTLQGGKIAILTLQ